ncbi:MAG: glycoside hydrolase family 95 protein [Bacteroidales bacterium]|nr:glycoside hydrolase family 95 protein [Bacteroidales bacterium]
MKNALKITFIIGLISLMNFTIKAQSENNLRLWYDKPATDWMKEALPIGNGYTGVMIFGNPEEEHIQFSEGTLWSGGPGSNPDYNFGIKQGVYKNLPEVRELLNEGKTNKADRLVKSKFTGTIHTGGNYNGDFGDYGGQQTMGDLFVKVKHEGEFRNYRRSLDISKAIASVDYEVNGAQYHREFFGNYPKNVFVYQFKSSVSTDYEIRFDSPHIKVVESFNDGVYSFQGKVADNNMGFETKFQLRLTEGEVSYKNGVIYIKGEKELNIVHTAATAYKLEFPSYNGNDFLLKNIEVMDVASKTSIQSLKEEHIADYTNLFNRVSFRLGKSSSDLPTNERLKKYYSGGNDQGMETLYFQYARYLMISGSRPNAMSMNLQGKWNNSTNPSWAADYHSNINLEMIYWPAELTNLSECHEPFLDYIESLVEPGKLAAKEFFNTRGWIVNSMCNAFGYTSIGWGIPWGYFPGGAGWFAQHHWDHYDFSQDKIYLEQQAYPLMKEAALFWIDYLTPDENGKLVSSPSYSPEHGTISSGASMDHQIAWDLLNNCAKANVVLGIEDDFSRKVIEVRDGILLPQIGSWGQLQEWKEDVDNPKSKHRHISHLFALHPGNQISTTKTPDLAEAAKVSLIARGDGGTGWSRAWKVNFWARLKDGNHAHEMLKYLMNPVASTGLDMTQGGGTYANLLCSHPPFQLDGNMGGTAGMVEMLVQSHSGAIELLPALPDVWNEGEVKGLKTRGGFTIDIKWDHNKLTSATIYSDQTKDCKVLYNDKLIDLTIKNGEAITIDPSKF